MKRSVFKFVSSFFPRSFCFSRKNLDVMAKANRSFWCRFSSMIFCHSSGGRRHPPKVFSFLASSLAHTERSSCSNDCLASLRILSDSRMAPFSFASRTNLSPSFFAFRLSP